MLLRFRALLRYNQRPSYVTNPLVNTIMRQGATILAIIALYGVIAYSMGIPLPPQPWRSYFGLAALEALLCYYNVPVIERMVGPTAKDGYTDAQNALVRSIEVTKMQRVYITLVMICSAFGQTAVLCCHDGVWSGPQSEAETIVASIGGAVHLFSTCIVLGGTSLGQTTFDVINPAVCDRIPDAAQLITGTSHQIENEEKALAKSLSPSAPVEAGTVESGTADPDLEAGLNSKQ
jgi:hypothetical protein